MNDRRKFSIKTLLLAYLSGALVMVAAFIVAAFNAWEKDDMARLQSLCDKGYVHQSRCDLAQARRDIPLIRKVPATKSKDCKIVDGEKMVCVHFVRGEMKLVEAR
jgi:L-2-hydroxyglutarate oxidase LhgO